MASVSLRVSAPLWLALVGMACGGHRPAVKPPVAVPALAASTCAELSQASLAKIAAMPHPEYEYFEPLPSDHGFGRCRAGVGGEWLLEVEKAEADDESQSLFVRLAFVSEDGRVFRAPPADVGVVPGAAAVVMLHMKRQALEQTFDWTDDGVAEVVVREDFSSGVDATFRWIWTFRDGVLAPLNELPRGIDTIRDVDGDGRPDVLSAGPFEVSFEVGADTETVPRTLRFLSRSVPGGFETSGPAVAAYYRATCGPERTLESIDGEAAQDVLEQAICARLYGADDAAVAERVDDIMRPLVEANDGEYVREGPFLEDPPVRL